MRNAYQETAEQNLAELADKSGRPKWPFEKLNKCMLDALTFQTLPSDRRTIVTARMISIIENQRSRRKRVRDWNQKVTDEQNAADRSGS